jgi:S1-C subfamily serine protease
MSVARAQEAPLHKAGYWTLRVGKDNPDMCMSSMSVRKGGTLILSAVAGEVSFAVMAAKPLREGRTAVLATEAYAFRFEPKYSDDHAFVFADETFNDRALAAVKLANQIEVSVDDRRVFSVVLSDTGFEEVFDDLIRCSNGEQGWWGEGATTTQAEAAAPSGNTTGTAFFISADGLAVTAAHVVDGCKTLDSMRWGSARVLAIDKRADLALVRMGSASGQHVFFRQRGPKLGEPLTVAGYPLGALLGSGLKITTGVVAGLAGPNGDRSLFQITAPIQPGNSGGPVIDSEGALLGVAVSKLDEIKLVEASGTFPQNVNFAVPISILQALLEENGISYKMANDRVGGASILTGFTFQVTCNR